MRKTTAAAGKRVRKTTAAAGKRVNREGSDQERDGSGQGCDKDHPHGREERRQSGRERYETGEEISLRIPAERCGKLPTTFTKRHHERGISASRS